MKMKHIGALVLALLMMAALLTGCGGKFESATDSMEMGNAGGLYERPSGSTVTTDISQFADQKLIKTVTVYAETEDLDTLMTQLDGQIRDLGGYIEYQDTYFGSAYDTYRHRSASMTVRIPAEQLDQFLLRVEGVSNVISKTQQQENITLQYVDTESRLAALQAEQDRLLELMEQAETMADLLEIEARLTEIRYELESVASQLQVMDNQVSYATVELEISEVEILTEVDEQTVWQRIGSGFTENLRNLGQFLVDLFVWIATYSPQLLILGGLIALVVHLCRRAAKKRRARRTPDPNPDA